MLIGAFAFASMGAFVHSLRERCDWPVIAVARSIVPLLIAGGMVVQAGVRMPVWRPATLWVRSVAGSLSLVSTFFAFTHMHNVSEVLTLTNLFPIWVALLSWPVLGIAPTGEVWIAALTGIVGVGLIQQPHMAEGNFAALAAFGASLFSAVAMIGLHRLNEIDMRAIVAHFSGVSLLFCIAAYFLPGRESPADAVWTADVVLRLFAVGGSATIGQFCLTRAFTSGEPAKVSVVGLSQVGFGMLFDLFLWERTFNAWTLVGMALVVAPTAWLLLRWRT